MSGKNVHSRSRIGHDTRAARYADAAIRAKNLAEVSFVGYW